MPIDFTTMIEDALESMPCEDMEREDCEADGESGSALVTLRDGRKFRVSYSRVH